MSAAVHPIIASIPNMILGNLEAALAQANTHSAFFDRGKEHWGNISVLNATHAGELAIKAAIAASDPLAVFARPIQVSPCDSDAEVLAKLLDTNTHSLSKLPTILNEVAGQDLPGIMTFNEIHDVRNAIQHFFHPIGFENYGTAAQNLSLRFIYECVDPLIQRNFSMYAIEYHEDSVGYDYLVSCLVHSELRFSVPRDFDISEIDLGHEISNTHDDYKTWLRNELEKIGKVGLLG